MKQSLEYVIKRGSIISDFDKFKRVCAVGTVAAIDKDNDDKKFPYTIILSVDKVLVNYKLYSSLFVCCRFDKSIDENELYKTPKGGVAAISGIFKDVQKIAGCSSINKVTLTDCIFTNTTYKEE